MSNVKIESDGMPGRAKITVGGEMMKFVTDIKIHISVDGVATAVITVLKPKIDCKINTKNTKITKKRI